MRSHFSPDARARSADAGFSRRSFLKGSGALVVAFSSAGVVDGLSEVFAQGFNGTGSTQLDSWIAIGRDGSSRHTPGKCEFGQGLYTAQMQLVAEEVCVPMSRVRLVQCDTSVTPDQGTTSGQQSHPTNFNHANLALAGATAREALIRLAATRLGAPASDLVARDGVVALRANPSRNVAYGDLIGGQRFNLQLDQAAARKTPARVDRPRHAGSARGHARHGDGPVRVRSQRQECPGMLHGRVVRPPEVGATVVSVDENSIRELPGIVKVVVKGNFVGVVAQKPWQAMQAAERLQRELDAGHTIVSPGGSVFGASKAAGT